MKQPSILKIGQASKALGISIDTLRRWEASGKINAERTAGGTRVYSPFVKIGEAAKVLGVSIDTLRRWERAGKIAPVRTPGSTRLYSLEELKHLRGEIVETPSTLELLQKKAIPELPNDDYQHFSHPIALETLIKQKVEERFENLVEPPSKPRKIYAKIYAGAALCLILALLLIGPIGLIRQMGLIGEKPKAKSEQPVVSDVLAASSIAEIGKFLEINADTIITGNLAVEGESIFGEGIIGKSTLSIAGASTLSTTTIGSTLSVTGLTTATGGLTTPGTLLIKPSSDPSSATKLFVIQNAAGTEKASIDSSGNASFAGTLGVTGATTLSSTLAVSGASTLSSTLKVSSATTLSSTLKVSGDSTLDGSLSVGGSLSQSGTATFTVNPSSTDFTKASIYINPSSNDTNDTALTVAVNGTLKAQLDYEGDLAIGYTSTTDLDLSNPFNVYGHSTTRVATIDTSGALTLADDLAVNGGDLTSTATTFNLLNSTVTTLNIGGAATAIELGTTSGTTSINNALTVDGNTTLGDATTDTITFTARLASSTSLIPVTDGGSDLGTSALRFNNLYVNTINASSSQSTSGQATFTYDPTSDIFSQASVYINPTTADSNDTGLTIALAGTLKAQIDYEGDAIFGYSSTTDPDLSVPLAIYNHGTTQVFTIEDTGVTTLTGTSSLDTETALNITGASLTTGELVDITGTYAPTAGGTQSAIDVNLTNSNTTSSNTLRGLDITTTDATALGNTVTNFYSSLTSSGNAAKTLTGYYSTLTSSSTTADTLVGVDIVSTHTGNISSGTKSIYGIRSIPNSSGATDTGGTINTYGGYFDATGAAGGTSSVFGVYIADVSGGDTNVALCFDCDGTYSASTVASGIQFGTDANAVTLYRSASDILRTGDGLTVDLDLIVSGGDITGTGDESIDIGEATANGITLLIDATGEVLLTSSALSPSTSDGNALGTTALMWADLFLASGGVINFNNGDVTLTHSTDALAVANGAFTITPTQTIASATGATWDGVSIPATTATISGSTNITTATGFNLVNIGQPTLSNASVVTTNAATLYIANAPTASGGGSITNPYALWVDAGATRLDGFLNMGNWADSTQAAVSAQGWAQNIAADTQNFSNASSTVAIGATTALGIATLTGNNATLTFTDAATLYIAGIPAASTNVAITNTALALWVDAGVSRFDGNVVVGSTRVPATNFEVNAGISSQSDAQYNIISFDPTSAAAGVGGGISFGGYYDGTASAANVFASIKGVKENATAGNLASYMAFTTRAAGGQPAERLRIDSSGNLIVGTGEASATLTGNTLRGPNASGTDIAGVTTTITASLGTGSGNAGILQFNAAAEKGATGTTAHTVSTLLQIGNTHSAQVGLTGAFLSQGALTYTDRATAGSGTATNAVFNSLAGPTLAAANTLVTTTNAATLYIAAAPTAGTNQTITNPYALWVDAGDTRLDGNVMVGGATVPTFAATVTGNIGPTNGPTIAATTQTNTTVDSTGSVGTASSIAIGPDGFPIISFIRAGTSVRVTKCGNAACSSGNTTTAVATGNIQAGQTTMAIGTDGLPVFIYMVDGADGIYVVKCGNLTCSSGNTSTRVVAATSAYSFAMAIGTDGFPVVVYSNPANNQTNFIKCSNASCSSSSETTNIAGQTNPNTGYNMVIGTDGFPIFSYKDGSNAYIRVTKCGNAACSSGNTSTDVDTNSTTNDGTTSIAIGTDGLPILSYQDSTNADLYVLHCGNTSCSGGNTRTQLDATGTVGLWSSLAIGTNGFAIISYYDTTNGDLKAYACSNIACSSGTAYTVNTGGASQACASGSCVGLQTSVAIGTDGLPVISYYDSSNADLLVTRCATTGCSATTGTALSGGYQLGGWMSNPRSFSAAMQSVNTFQISNPSTFQRLGILTGGSEQVSITPAGLVGIGTTSPTGLLNLSKATFGTPGTTGQYLNISASTFTDTSTAASGTATNMVFNAIATPTLAASNTSVTTTNAATFYIAAAPTAGTNMTITNPYALWVDAGAARFDGPVAFGAQQTLTANSTTPSVSAGSHFITANTTAPTLISNFTSGHSGQILVIELGDSVTDFDCTVSNLNCGGADITTGATGDIFTFVYDGTNWNLINWMDTSATQTGADIAEWYVSSESLEPGDVVSITSEESEPTSEVDNALIEKSKVIYDQKAIGIVSTAPGIVLGEETQFTFAVALAGRVPVKVSTENGPIEKGDYLTSSSTPGVAMRATQPGSVVGKALESYNNEEIGKILVFVNVSFADPSQALANLLLDEEGNLVIPKVKTASLEIGPISQIGQISPMENALDVASKLKILDETIATQSATLASLKDSIASATASLQNDVDSLKLTPPEILLATGSATLANIKVTETLSSEKLLTALDVNISGVFKALGESFMGNTTIAGNLVVDGTFSISGNSINVIGSNLYLQNNSLAEGLDILNGKFIFDKEGKLTVAGTVEAEQFSVTSGKSAGTGKILAGQVEAVVENEFVTENSLVLLTPEIPLSQTLAVTNKQSLPSYEGKTNGKFTVKLNHSETQDITFSYLIIGQGQKVSGL